MAALPSYQEATARIDWLRLVSPYVAFADYRALCLVNRRFHDVFASLLWRDPIKSARQNGLNPEDDLTWWFDFVFSRLKHVTPITRRLVRVLDARNFAKDSYHFASDEQEVSIQQSFKRAWTMFDNVAAIILDAHPDIDPVFLAERTGNGQDEHPRHHQPLLLSVANCSNHLPNNFFSSPNLHTLVYLDISGLPGSISALIQSSPLLPSLRILKVCDRELDDVTLKLISKAFRTQLWSLDLGNNNITDEVVQTLREWCIPVADLRSSAHFQTEGRLTPLPHGTSAYGPFVRLQESDSSGSFDHPDRYLIDAPGYATDAEAGDVRRLGAVRSDGRGSVRDDSADTAARILLSRDAHAVDGFRETRGITHLRLSNNQVSSFGIEKLLRISNGQLEHLTCDYLPVLSPSSNFVNFWPKKAKLFGMLGMAHVFRPVFSPNLRSLRVHHSLVTNIPTIEAEGFSNLACIHIAETQVLPRTEQAYPLAFVPDMNPRLTSLTLTGIPRRSSGPLTQKLLNFLRLLSIQECSIQNANRLTSSRRGSNLLLMGLRHLRLEFEPDQMEDGFSTTEELDAEELMSSGDRGFSFFDEGVEGERAAPSLANPRSQARPAENSSAASNHRPSHTTHSAECNRDSCLEYHGEWNGEVFSVSVWAGPHTPSTSNSGDVLDEYHRLVRHCNVRDSVGPASPSQIAAGAPEKSFVFHTAWCLAVMPQELNAPERGSLTGMRDVLDALRTYRLSGRAKYEELKWQTKRSAMASKGNGLQQVLLGEPHYFWTGRLEVSTEKSVTRGVGQYWR